MARLSYLAFVFVVGNHGSVGEEMTTIKLGMDVNYPPYAMATEDGELAGFAVDFAQGMNALCPNINIEMVQDTWPNCWEDTDGGKIGPSIEDGTIDGCVTYIHTHVRDDRAEFTGAILDDNKAAGLLTLLDDSGNPLVTGMDDLEGKTLIDVAGWAPSGDALKFLTNKCTNEKYSTDVEIIVADVDDTSDNPNDVAMRMLRDGEGDAIFMNTDLAKGYVGCPEDAVWNCTLWKGFGKEHAYVQTGQFSYVKNGTTFAIAKKGSGIRELLQPCMGAFMASQEYYKICSKYDIVDKCYSNDYFDEDTRSVLIYDRPTNEQFGDCSNGYCPCSAGMAVTNEAQDSNESSSSPAWAIAVITVGAVLAVAILVLGYKTHQKRRKVHLQKKREEQELNDLKKRVSNHANQADIAVTMEAGTISSGHTAEKH